MISPSDIANLQLSHGATQVCVEQELEHILKEAFNAVSKHRQGQLALARKNKAKTQLLDIYEGRAIYDDQDSKAKAINFAEFTIHQANKTLVNIGAIQYCKPMMLIYQYCLKCKEYLMSGTDTTQYNLVLSASLHNLESLLDNLQGSRNGTTQDSSLSKSTSHSYDKLLQIELHLQERLKNMTNKRSREVGEVMQVSIVQNALSKAFELPDDSFILFFEKGMLLQKKGHDERFYTQTFDVDRLRKNDGRLDRLIGHQPDGYVVIRAMLDSKGDPMVSKTAGRILKEVIDFAGDVPENIVKGMDLGLLLRKYKQRIDTVSGTVKSEEVQSIAT